MSSRISVTAFVTGILPFVHRPQLREGEILLQFLVRYHPQQWKNLIKYARTELGAQEHTCKLPQSLSISDITDPMIISPVERWVSRRLATHYRVLHFLVDLCKMIEKGRGGMMSLELVQILWPWEKNPSGGTKE